MGRLTYYVLGAVLSTLTALFIQIWRKSRARVRLAEFDAGKRCMGCDSLEVKLVGGEVRCDRCGYVMSLEAIRNEKLTLQELNAATAVDDNFNKL